MSIATEISRIQSAKTDIRTAIEAKGVTVPSSATIDTYDTYVAQISGGGGQTYEAELMGMIDGSLTSIDIPSGTTIIKDFCFEEFEYLEDVNIPDSVTSIGESAFYGCTSLTSCTIGSGVTSIGLGAFGDCSSLTSIDIPNSVTSIGESAFQECTSLTSVTIGSGITEIGDNAFVFCTSLTSITINATTPPTLGYAAFDDTNDCPIYVPSASVAAYQTDWEDYASRITAIPNS